MNNIIQFLAINKELSFNLKNGICESCHEEEGFQRVFYNEKTGLVLCALHDAAND